jgi:hypothetical protein
MELSNFSSCEDFYRHGSSIAEIREWNRNPGQNVLLLLIEGCLVISVGFMGFLGNLFTISVLLRKEMRSSFSCLLIALAVCDALVTISGTFVHGFTGVSDYYPEYWSEYRKKFAAPLMVFFYPLRYAGKHSRLLGFSTAYCASSCASVRTALLVTYACILYISHTAARYP